MSTEEHISVAVANGWQRLLRRGAARIPMALLLLSGILHATPITGVGESQLHDSKQLANRAVPLDATKAALQPLVAEPTLASHPDSATFVQPASAVCILASDCSAPVQVPEPQSLVLVGSGLLSMAGVLRRRFLRG
jgi:hypothetical protein